MDREISERPSRRHSFILTLWAEAGPFVDSPPVWRISLENPHTTERRGFKNLAELIHYLEQWTAERPSGKSNQS